MKLPQYKLDNGYVFHLIFDRNSVDIVDHCIDFRPVGIINSGSCLRHHADKLVKVQLVFLTFQMQNFICDRICIKGPLVGNLKNEIIKFYDKLGFKVSFPLISERNLLFLLY